MRKKTVRGSGGLARSLSGLLLLAVFFAGGILLGQALAGRVPDGTGAELRRYLTDFLQLEDGAADHARTAVSAVAIYFRWRRFYWPLQLPERSCSRVSPWRMDAFSPFPSAALRRLLGRKGRCWRWRCWGFGAW